MINHVDWVILFIMNAVDEMTKSWEQKLAEAVARAQAAAAATAAGDDAGTTAKSSFFMAFVLNCVSSICSVKMCCRHEHGVWRQVV